MTAREKLHAMWGVEDYAKGVAEWVRMRREYGDRVTERWLSAVETAWPNAPFTEGARDAANKHHDETAT